MKTEFWLFQWNNYWQYDILTNVVLKFRKWLTLNMVKRHNLRAEQSRAEQSRAEQSRAEQSRAEQSRAEQSRGRAEQSRAEQVNTAPVCVEKNIFISRRTVRRYCLFFAP